MLTFSSELPDVCSLMSTGLETQFPGGIGNTALVSDASRWDYADMSENAQHR